MLRSLIHFESRFLIDKDVSGLLTIHCQNTRMFSSYVIFPFWMAYPNLERQIPLKHCKYTTDKLAKAELSIVHIWTRERKTGWTVKTLTTHQWQVTSRNGHRSRTSHRSQRWTSKFGSSLSKKFLGFTLLRERAAFSFLSHSFEIIYLKSDWNWNEKTELLKC